MGLRKIKLVSGLIKTNHCALLLKIHLNLLNSFKKLGTILF